MSITSWHNYGIGICTDEIDTDVEHLQKLLEKAPELEEKIQHWLAERGIDDPTWDDYMDFDQDYYLGLATIMKEVILEAEGIEMTACDSSDAVMFLLYQPKYPWEQQPVEVNMTEEDLTALFGRYIRILTDTPIEVERQEIENFG